MRSRYFCLSSLVIGRRQHSHLRMMATGAHKVADCRLGSWRSAGVDVDHQSIGQRCSSLLDWSSWRATT